MALDIRTRKNLKALGHKLNPVVMVAGKGLSDLGLFLIALIIWALRTWKPELQEKD